MTGDVSIVGKAVLSAETPEVVVARLREQFPNVTFSTQNIPYDAIQVYSEEDVSENMPAREVVRMAIAQAREQAEPPVRAWQLHELAYVPPEICPYPLGHLDLQALREDVEERSDTFQWDPDEVPGDGDPDEIAIVDLVPYGAERGWRLLGRCTPEGSVSWELGRA